MTFEYRLYSRCTAQYTPWRRYKHEYTTTKARDAAMEKCRLQGYEVRPVE